jgi:hypothetical protein
MSIVWKNQPRLTEEELKKIFKTNDLTATTQALI